MMWLWTSLRLLCLVAQIFLLFSSLVETVPRGGRGNNKGKSENCKKLKFAVRIYQDNEEVRVFVGSDFKFDCRVIGLPQPNITWTKDDTRLKDVSYRSFGRRALEKVFSLNLKNLLVADSGRYKCTADNGECKTISNTFRLIVTEKVATEIPRIKELLPLTPKIYIGESVTFSCTVRKFEDFAPFIKWVRYRTVESRKTSGENGKDTNVTSLPPSLPRTTRRVTIATTSLSDPTLNIERLSTTTNVIDGIVHETTDLKLETGHRSELIVSSASLESTGVYSCVAFNEVGFDKVDAHLLVEPRPGLSKAELERRYIKKYGTSIKLPFSLATVVVIPVCLLIILIIGCVWWHSNQQKLEDEQKTLEKQKQIENSRSEEKKTTTVSGITPMMSVQSTSSDSGNVTAREMSLRNIGEKSANVNESDDQARLLVGSKVTSKNENSHHA